MQTTAQRLQAARAYTAKIAENYPASAHHCNWRNNVARPFKPQPSACNWQHDYTGPRSARPYLIDCLESPGWRVTGDASDVLRSAGAWRAAGDCNWYADHYQEAVIKSAVLQLPSRDGLPVYIPATYCSDWDGATCYPLDQYDTPEGAARAAAGYAETEAEKSREWQARDRAEQDTAEARQEIHRINTEALALVREIKKQGRAFSPAICQALRGQLLEFMGDRREQFAIIDARAADYWSATR